jgi:hypothetical protein
LAESTRRAFQGSNGLGQGFFLTDAEAAELLQRDPRNADVLRRFLVAEDLTQRPDQSPGRWVINFSTWPLERAEQYADCMAIVREKVKPVRATNRDARRRKLWWQFTRPTADLYDAIQGFDRVLVGPAVSKFWFVVWCPNGIVYSHRTFVFNLNDDGHAAVLSSTFHDAWARRYSSTLETRLNYSPTDCLQTFPFPTDVSLLDQVGDHYLSYRKTTLLAADQGLTQIYNRVHEQPGDTTEPIEELRRLRRELDRAVASAYGWTDIELDHDFRETPLGLRYTVSEPVKTEALDRLLELNHVRYDEEVALGLHGQKRTKSTPKMAAQARHSNERLFD